MIKTFVTTLTEKTQMTHNVVLFKFSLKPEDKLEFKAGQYMIVRINNTPRLYSIYSPDYINDSFQLFVKIVEGGLATTYLNGLKVGDQVTFQGPGGVFTLKETETTKVFLATVTGLAPMMSVIKSHYQKNPQSQVKMKLLWGLQSKEDLCLLEELKAIKKDHPNFDFKVCLSREKDLSFVKDEDKQYFTLGRLNSGIDDLGKTEDLKTIEYYLCGSRVVVEAMRQYIESKGVAKELVHFERF